MSAPDKGERIIALAYPVRLTKIERELAGAAAQMQQKSFSEYVRVLINRDLNQGATR
jgi:hypothetical protein